MGPENIRIDQATIDDIGDIQFLFRKMFVIYHIDQNIEYPYTDSGISYLKNCIEDQFALTAKGKARTIGFLTGGIEDALPFKTFQQLGHIHNLFVLEEFRGRGIGRALILQFIQKCKDNNIYRIVTDSDDTEALRRFYGSVGFRISGVNYEMDSSC